MYSFDEALNEIINHISQLKNKVNKLKVEEIVKTILEANKIFCYGAGRSGFIARCFAQRLMHIELKAYFIGETITPKCHRNEILIIVSGSGKTTSSMCFAKKLKR